jgi:hypothetical protein
MVIDVLGAEYEIVFSNKEKDLKLNNCDGYCDDTLHKIVVLDCEEMKTDIMAKGDPDNYKQKVLRHEIIHAFLFESGLSLNSDWADNEEMIDWIAYQLPKIQKALESIKF